MKLRFFLFILTLYSTSLLAYNSISTLNENTPVDNEKLYITLKTPESKQVEYFVYKGGELKSAEISSIIIYSVFVFLFLSLFLYNLALYARTREKSYLIYSIYILSLFIFISFTKEYLSFFFDSDLSSQNIIKPLSLQSAFIIFLFFSLRCLDIKKTSLKLYKNLIVTALMSSFLYIAIVFSSEIPESILEMSFLLYETLFFMFIGITAYLNKTKYAKIYLLSLGGFLIGIVAYAMTMNSLSLLLASAWKMIFISLAMGNKLKELQTERSRYILQSEEQNKMLFLQSKYASMGETIGNIAHQWKQPLNAIGSIQNSIKAALVFKGEISKDKLLQSVDTSFKLLEHLGETIDTFYGFLSQKNSTESSFLISDEFEAIKKITEYSFQNSNIKLLFELDANPALQGNANEFTHAMLNIILNAKNALEGSKESNPTIVVKITEKDENCIITVSDNAGGIKIKPIESIFDWHISSKENSSGVGLYMTKNIIERRFGGSIKVQNMEHGALFTIKLPYSIQNETFADITESYEKPTLEQIQRLSRKIIELEELEKTLKRWAEIFEHAQWGISVHIGTSEHFENTNPAFNKLYGYTKEELKTKSVSDLFAPESLKELPKIREEAFEKGYAIFETLNKRKDGSLFPVTIELIIIKDENNEILYHIANIWDLTEKKEVEEKLKLNRFAIENIQEAVFMIDKDAHFAYVNKAACSSLGYTKEELLSMSVADINPNWPKERWPEFWNMLQENKTAMIKVTHKRRDGTTFPVEISANYFEYKGVGYNLALAKDITERIEMEKRKEDEKMRLFFERQLVGMAITSPQKGWITTNKKLQQMLGYTHEELSMLTWTELTYPEDLAPDVEQFERLLADEIEDYMLEKRFIRKDGSIVYTNLAVSCVRNDDRTVNYVLALLEDITEQKQTHEALALKEREFRSLTENIPDNVARWDTEGRYIYINPTQERLLEMSLSEAIGNYIPDSHTEVKIAIKKVVETKEKVIVQQQVLGDNGETEIHDISLVPEFDESEKVVSVLGIGRDMTAIYRLQDEIVIKEEQFRTLVENLPDKVIRYDKECRAVYVSPLMAEVFGDDALTMLMGKTPIEAHQNHYFHAEAYQSKLEKVIATGEKEYLSHELLLPTGDMQYGQIRFVAERDQKGEICGALAIGTDITELKNAENSVRSLNETLEKRVEERTAELKQALDFNSGIINAIPDLMFEVNKEGIYLNVWAKNEELLAAQKELLLGNKISDILSPEASAVAMEAIKEADEKGLSFGKTLKIDLSDGTHWFELSSSKKADGNIIFISRDVTERKVAQMKLEKEQKKFTKIAIAAPGVNYIFEKTVDGELRFLYLAPTFEELFGFSNETALGDFSKIMDAIDSKDTDTIRQSIVSTAENLTPWQEQFRINHPLKGEIWIEGESKPEKLPEGNVVWYGFFHDISDKKKYEQEIKELNKTLERKVLERTHDLQKALSFNESIIQAIPDMLFEISKEGVYLNIWARDEKLLAKQKELLLGKNFKDMLPPEAVEISYKTMKEVDKYGSSLGNTYKLDLPDGEHWFELHTTRKEPENTYLALVRDVTDRKKAQNALTRLNADLEKKVKDRTIELVQALEFNENIINTLPDLLFEMDMKGNYLNIWAQDKELLAAQKEILLGNNIYNVLSKEAADTIIEAFKDANLHKHSWGREIFIELPQGRRKFELSVSKKNDGNFLILSRDITERKPA